MKGNIETAMARIDEIRAQRQEEARQDMLTRLDPDSVEALMQTGDMMWRTERQVIETRLREALQELNA
ncbi:MAG: hypothetical protein FJX25_06320 [Alphaproteobacteria bacterium]|nr:hypothetical protein [Alphaproteobacteria bacterium]